MHPTIPPISLLWNARRPTSILSSVFVEVEGLRLHVEQAGAGPPLLLLHGWAGSTRAFAPLLPALTPSFAVCAVDFPGCGSSSLPAAPWGVCEYVRCVRELMRRLGIGQAHVLGHSHGGRVAIALASESPELVDHLVLVDSAGIRAPRTLRLRSRGLVARSARRLLSHPLAGQTGRRALARVYSWLGMSDYASAGPLRATLVRIVNEDLSGLLPQISAPTLVVWGAQDRETPLWMGRQMARTIPGAEFLLLERAGHFSYLERPEAFQARLLDFLSEPVAS